jgi:hypothetical protein
MSPRASRPSQSSDEAADGSWLNGSRSQLHVDCCGAAAFGMALHEHNREQREIATGIIWTMGSAASRAPQALKSWLECRWYMIAQHFVLQ